MRHRFVFASTMDAPVRRVFAFHEEPGALMRLSPPWQPVELVSGGGSLLPGTRVVLRLSLGPLSQTWVAEHTEFQRDRLFVDRMVEGPFAHWVHRHRFEPTPEGGTRLTDDIEYELPGGRLGDWLTVPVESQLRRMFAYRHRITRRCCET